MIRLLLSFCTLGLVPWRRRDSLDMLDMSLTDICSHVLAIGGSGSGKTSVLKVWLVDVFRRGGKSVGAIVAAVKADEWDNMQAIAKRAGVTNRLVRLAPKTFTFNFLAWQLSQPGSTPQSAASLLNDLNRLSNKTSGGSDEQFWANLFNKTAVAAITICWLARKNRCTVETVYQLIVSSPSSFENLKNESYRERSFCFQLMREAEANLQTEDDRRQLRQAVSFFTQEALQLGDKARGAAISQVLAVLTPFLQGDLYDIVCCEEDTFSPEDPSRGKIVVIDFPTMVYGDGGRFIIALILKQVTQHSLSRRRPKTTTLVIRDELPEIVGDPAEEVSNMALARSTRTAFVSGVQSVPTLQESLGGSQGEQAVHSVISNYATKLVLSTACPKTAEMFSTAWGEARENFVSVSETKDHEDFNLLDFFTDDRLLFSLNQQLVPRCPPDAMLRLRRGGRGNRYRVDFFLCQAGRTYGANAYPFKLVTFKQI